MRDRFVWLFAFALGIAGLIVWLRGDDVRRLLTTERVERWPRIAELDLTLDLTRTARFAARGRLVLEDVRARRVPLLLNEALALDSAERRGGGKLAWEAGRRLRSAYHREARVTWLDLGEPPADGKLELELAYSGPAADGGGNVDWRGILLHAPDELRMSEQTVFYPQVPAEPDASGPGVELVRGSLEVTAPADFELFAAGRPVEARVPPPAGARAWRFEFDEPAVLSLLGGRRVRTEIEQDGMGLVLLLSEAHASFAPAIAAEARAVLAFYSRRFGPVPGRRFGIVEIQGRGDSYNWTSQGVAAFESGAFRGGGLSAEKLGHEIAHLWWGQAVTASGAGERFLTEGLAEYSSWRWVEERHGPEAAAAARREARDDWLSVAHEKRLDPPLAEVGFRTPGYSAFAYSKGALVFQAAETSLGREAFDAGLARYLANAAGVGGTLERLLAALFGDVARGEETLPWIRRAGHAHVRLADVVRGTDATRGRVELEPCPSGIVGPAPRLVVLRHSATESGRVGCELDAAGRAGFELPAAADFLSIDSESAPLCAGDHVWSLRRPRLVASDPPQAAVGVPYLRERIELVFDRPLAPLGTKARSRLVHALVSGAQARGLMWPPIGEPVLEDGGLRLVLLLSQPLEAEREIAVVLDDGLDDADGLPLAGVALTFETEAPTDRERPRIVGTAPSTGAQGVDPELDEIRIEFSEPMRPGRGYSSTLVRELAEQGWGFPLIGRTDSGWEDGGRVLVYELVQPLERGARYRLPLRAAFRDLAGNELVDFDLDFEVAR